MFAKLIVAFLVILLANLAITAPTPTIVPRISYEGFELNPYDNQYFLSIRLPDGTIREETVEEIAPGQLQVNGVLNEPFAKEGKHLVVTYEAGPNGYVAKVRYGPATPAPTFVPQFLPANVLKSAAG